MATRMERMIIASLFTPTPWGWGLPLHFWGPPGVGKSAILRLIAERVKGFPLEVLSPGERGEGAFGVTPVPAKNGYLKFPAPDWTQKFDEVKRGLVFIDEANTAPPAMQPALLGLFLDRRIGGHYMGNGVRMLMAANPTNISAGGWDYPLPVANRMGHVDWEAPSVEDWCDWLMRVETDDVGGRLIDPDEEEERVLEAWPEAWARATVIVQGFLRARPLFLHKQPEDGHPDCGRAWPSHRTWEMTARALASALVHDMPEDLADDFAGSFVGQATFSEFVAYRADADLPNPAEVLNGKVKFKHQPARLDRSFAVLGGCAQLVSTMAKEKNPQFKDAADVMFSLMRKVAEDAIDVVWPAATIMSKAGLHKHNEDSKALFRKLFPAAQDASRAA